MNVPLGAAVADVIVQLVYKKKECLKRFSTSGTAHHMLSATVNEVVGTHTVTFETWFDNEYDYLCDIYNFIKEANERTGRHLFSQCSLNAFASLAYMHSQKYKTSNAWMQGRDYAPDDDTVVFD